MFCHLPVPAFSWPYTVMYGFGVHYFSPPSLLSTEETKKFA